MKKPFLGFGLGLRTQHFEHVLQNKPAIDWFEVVSENFMVAGGKPRYYLSAIAEHYPIVMHGVSMSIGSTDPLNWDYLKHLKTVIADVKPQWVSDHLCWTGVHGHNAHDLLPLPYNQETIQHLVGRITQVQDFLGQPILLENVSSYLTFKNSEMSEWDFYNEVVQQSNCLMLLDVNNIYVSARNHGFDPIDYIQAIKPNKVQQIHLAGHTDNGDYVIDTHDHDVCDDVWQLYQKTLEHLGPVSTMIERDDNIPEFEVLQNELELAKNIAKQIFTDDKNMV